MTEMPADDEVETELVTAEDALWRLVSALGECTTVAQVVNVQAREGGAAAGGAVTGMAVLNRASNVVEVVASPLGDAASGAQASFPLDDQLPACETVRTGLPVLLGSEREIAARYPALSSRVSGAGLRSLAYVPVLSGKGEALGAVSFGWAQQQAFLAPQVRRLDLIAQLMGLALQRSGEQGPDAANQRPTQVLETMPNALLSLSSDFAINYINTEGERLLRSSREALVGRNLFQALPEAANSRFEEQYRSALASGKPVIFEEYYAPLETWFEVHAWPDQQGLNVYFSDISERRRAELERSAALEDAIRANAKLSFLAQLNANLAGAGSLKEILERVSRSVVGTLADWCTVVVPEEDSLVRVAAAHRLPILDQLAKRLVSTYPHSFDGPSPGVVVYRQKAPLRLARLARQIVDDLDDSVASAAYGRTLQLLGDGPGVIYPIFWHGEIAAILTMVRSDGTLWSDADLEMLAEVAACISTCIDDAHNIETQRQTAGALQAAALPKSLPSYPGLALAAGYRAASEGSQVGGDWYDAFELQNGSIALVVGDAAGHGLQAAAVMTQIRNVLRAHLFGGLEPADALAQLSGLMSVQEPEAFATVICLEVDRAGDVVWASAGHPAPVLLRADGTSTHLPGEAGPPIGCAGRAGLQPPPSHEFTLSPMDRLVIFTDGLVEKRGVNIEIGLAHLMLTVEEARTCPDAGSACDMILERMLPGAHEDDVCLLVADRKGVPDLS